MFNLGRVFASLTRNTLFWRKMKWSLSHTDAKKRNKQKPKKQVTSYISTYKAAGNNKSKLKQTCVLTSMKWAREMTGISDYGRMSTFCVRRSKQFQESLEPTTFCILPHTLLYRSIDASFDDFVLVFTFHYEMTAKA